MVGAAFGASLPPVSDGSVDPGRYKGETSSPSTYAFLTYTTTPSRAVITPRFITSHGAGRRTTAAQ